MRLYIYQEVVVNLVWFTTHLVNQLELQTSVVLSRIGATSKVSQVDRLSSHGSWIRAREGSKPAGRPSFNGRAFYLFISDCQVITIDKRLGRFIFTCRTVELVCWLVYQEKRLYIHEVGSNRLTTIVIASDLFGLAWRGSEVKSAPRPQYLIWRQARRGPRLQILAQILYHVRIRKGAQKIALF